MTVIACEIERFNRLSATWWNHEGPMRPLHVVNALRLEYVVERMASRFGLGTAGASLASFVFAILGVEYVLRVLPRGTHAWRQFMRPAELAAAVGRCGLHCADLRGMRYDPFRHTAAWRRDTRVNCIAVFESGKR